MKEESIKGILIAIIVVLLLIIAFWTVIKKSIVDAPVPNSIYGNNFHKDFNAVFENAYKKQ